MLLAFTMRLVTCIWKEEGNEPVAMIKGLEGIDPLVEPVLVPLLHAECANMDQAMKQFVKPSESWRQRNAFQASKVSRSTHIWRRQPDIQPSDEQCDWCKHRDDVNNHTERRNKAQCATNGTSCRVIDGTIDCTHVSDESIEDPSNRSDIVKSRRRAR